MSIDSTVLLGFTVVICSSSQDVLALQQESSKQQISAPRVPESPVPRFTGLERPWPPAPARRRRERVRKPGNEIPGSLTIHLRRQIVETCSRSLRVHALLGDRFAFVGMDEVSNKQATGMARRSSSGPEVIVTYFSHTNNTAVRVRTAGVEILEVTRETSLQPAAGAEEIARAVTLARKDDRLKASVMYLEGGAILVVPSADQPGYGHRVLYVTFAKRLGMHVQDFAEVDLTDEKVLLVGNADRKEY